MLMFYFLCVCVRVFFHIWLFCGAYIISHDRATITNSKNQLFRAYLAFNERFDTSSTIYQCTNPMESRYLCRKSYVRKIHFAIYYLCIFECWVYFILAPPKTMGNWLRKRSICAWKRSVFIMFTPHHKWEHFQSIVIILGQQQQQQQHRIDEYVGGASWYIFHGPWAILGTINRMSKTVTDSHSMSVAHVYAFHASRLLSHSFSIHCQKITDNMHYVV